MPFNDNVYLGLYFSVIGVLSLLGLHRYLMVYLYYRHKQDVPVPVRTYADGELPTVTLQLPVFNEMYVVERLLDAVCALDYPKHRLQIQVLDDSTDETVATARAKVAECRARGFDIEHIHRQDRTGYKAGALDAALSRATGELIAILDADFVPDPDFLRSTVHFFSDPKIAVVQARWGHLNRESSLLTELQSIFLDGHLVLEQTARNRSGRFINFNGTGGLWRTSAIADAGGWHHDTLTEDTDLSFRAQLKGWKCVFLKDVIVPAELPPDMLAFKSQQHRWTKGLVQVARKLLGTIWRSDAPFKCKLEATVHLGMGVSYPLMIVLVLLLSPVVQMRFDIGWFEMLFVDLPLFCAASVSIFLFYFVSQREAYARVLPRVKYLPMLIALGVGMVVNNTRAFFEGLFGVTSEFVRTPKYNSVGKASGEWRRKRYKAARNALVALVEIGLGVYCTVPLAAAITSGRWMVIPFVSLFVFGFFYVGFYSMPWGALLRRRATADDPTLELPPLLAKAMDDAEAGIFAYDSAPAYEGDLVPVGAGEPAMADAAP